MTKKQTLIGLIILAVASLLIAACSGQQPTPEIPTVDANAIYTQAAETVQAGFAQTEAARPSPEPSQTQAPTSTMEADMAAGLTSTANAVLQPAAGDAPTLAAGQPTLALATAATLPTATSAVVAPPPSATGDKAELVGQTPTDGTNITKSASFTTTIVLKNVGTTTWSTKYSLAFYAGDRMGSPQDFNMPHEVKPNESVRLIFDMKASDSPGKKRTIWALRNADGVNFYDLWLETNVTE
jgi:hypothetical protein